MNGLQNVGEDGANHEVDGVAVEQALHLGDRHVGLQFVVDDGHLGVEPAELAAQGVDRQIEPVAHLTAEHRRRAGKRDDQPDLDLVLGASG